MSKRSSGVWFGLGLILPSVVVGGAFWYRSVVFDQNCGGLLVRAANANTIPLAHAELDRAVKYLESEGLTDGYTSVWYQTPDEDIGFWYKNLVEARSELKSLTEKGEGKVSALEQSNTLLKLRDTLTTNKGQGGESLTYPDGISRYPNNAVMGLFAILSGLFAFVGFITVGLDTKK